MLRLEILPPPQRKLWDEMQDAAPEGFVLYGGTALALRLGHRVSEDFDFFSNAPFVPAELEARVPFLAGAERIQSSPNTLKALCYFEDGDLPALSSGIRTRLTKAAQAVEPNELPEVTPLPGGLAP
ncbi:MAG TPA: nucleotidyl transferase AbiEii/AbiGii toxin family protein [Thermoanaerobaculia bacterium]|nr:nucleotidyl transferase AbiEii/AbiGii toxin family protein [Thermoanaerobaculia bacterium]